MAISITIDGSKLTAQPEQTILEIATDNGIYIPTLCYHPDVSPIGACRLCLVEVEGSRPLVASCHTPAREGMAIHTCSDRVIQARRVVIELILASHPDNCFFCNKANLCELRRVAAELSIGTPRCETKKRFYQTEEASPYIVRDLSKCILCRRCVKICAKVKGKPLISVGYRGFRSKIVAARDKPLLADECRDCEECVMICPVGALSRPVDRFIRTGTPLTLGEHSSL